MKINEEIESYINEEEPIYKNPSVVELNKMARDFGKGVRIIANERTGSFYVFPYANLHYTVTRKLTEFQDIQKLMGTTDQPSYIFTATGTIENNKITLTNSDIISWSRFNQDIRKEIKMRNWSFCDKYLNNSVKDFLKKLKINK